MTLTEFLLARIAEDATRARESTGFIGRTVASVRMLAECEAKRLLVEAHGSNDPKWEGDCPHCGVHGPCYTIRLVALPYADHPDYRDEWRY